ncbi:MAG: FHA domain-containing protein [Planctomycetes bacterium]|nr:FHA domain-containing protein [Planctomycetota bacterium]
MSAGSIRLEVVEGESKGSAVVLSGISMIGRDPSCALVVADRAVSREHALVRPEEGFGFVLEDLDSRAGTFVNGVRTRKAVLQDGDAIRLGGTVLRVRAPQGGLVGEVRPEHVEVVKTRFMPTARLTLDAVRFRTRVRDLSEAAGASSGEAAPLDEGDDRPTSRLPVDEPPSQPIAEEPAPDDAAAVARRLELLCEISTSLAAIHDPTRLTRETALRLFGMFPQARRIGFFELEEDPRGGDAVLRPRYLVDRSAREQGARVRVSHSVLQMAVAQRQAVLSEDVSLDLRFKGTQSLEEAGVQSIICVPLCLGDRTLGALYLDASDPARPFDPGALRLVTGVAAILAASFENARLFARVQAETVRRASLERYFSPDLVERVLKGEVPLARQGQLARGTFLFVDIRGFTRLTEVTPPPVLVSALNAYFATMQRIIFRGGGTVERFGGDSILAYWGVVDVDPRSPLRACRAALAMQAEVFRLNPELEAEGRPRLKVAVGINSGEVIAGEVGSPERYEFTILGDAVNLARRLEGQALGGEVIAGAATIAHLGDAALHRPLPAVAVKGKAQPVALSALYGLAADQPAAGGRRWDLALPGTFDAGAGGPPEEVLATGLEVSRGRASLEVLTAQDPVPGAATRLTLSLPRGERPLQAVARVRGASTEDTTMLSAGALRGLQRILLEVDAPAAMLQALGVV